MQLQTDMKYIFKDINLLKLALTHKSFDKNINNERLEFLGDAVLGLIITKYCYQNSLEDEGVLTKMRASMVNESSLALYASELMLGDHIVLSATEERNNGRSRPSILANTCEALIAAVYLDSGFSEAEVIVRRLLDSLSSKVNLMDLNRDYKTLLQEVTQEMFNVTPTYETEKEIGPDHNKQFRVKVSFNNKVYARKMASSKKKAEHACAKIAYFKLTQGDQNTNE